MFFNTNYINVCCKHFFMKLVEVFVDSVEIILLLQENTQKKEKTSLVGSDDISRHFFRKKNFFFGYPDTASCSGFTNSIL